MIEIFIPELDEPQDYFTVKYYLQSSTTLRDAAWNLAIGQSVGNPNVRSEFETDELFEKHSCRILHTEAQLETSKDGIVNIAFPKTNVNLHEDGVAHLLVQIMGGQCDIDIIQKCIVMGIVFPQSMLDHFQGPVIGLNEMKKQCDAFGKPLLGGIIKPKIGMKPEENLELVKQLVDGGCNFIKEDEILSNQSWCRVEDRLGMIMDYIESANSRVFYCVSTHCDPGDLLDRVDLIESLGGNGMHVNFHCGLGAYKSIRDYEFSGLIHYQKSGDKLINCSDHNFYIHHDVIFYLVSLSGAGSLHCGMIGGYMDNDTNSVIQTVNMLSSYNSVPALSCGMHPGIVDHISETLGHTSWMANVGGAISGHPSGTYAGALAMRQAIDKNYGPEYHTAIEKWGKI